MDGCSLLSRRVVFTTDTTCDIFLSAYVFIFLPPLSLTLLHILASSLILLSLPSLAPLLAGRLGGDKFGGGQAEGGQTRSLCVHIVEQEAGRGGGGVAGALIGSGGGLEEASLPKKRLHLPSFSTDARGS